MVDILPVRLRTSLRWMYIGGFFSSESRFLRHRSRLGFLLFPFVNRPSQSELDCTLAASRHACRLYSLPLLDPCLKNMRLTIPSRSLYPSPNQKDVVIRSSYILLHSYVLRVYSFPKKKRKKKGVALGPTRRTRSSPELPYRDERDNA